MYNNNAKGPSSQSTTTTSNGDNNASSRANPQVPATNGSGNGNNIATELQPPPLQLQLLQEPGITVDWSADEQAILDEGLTNPLYFDDPINPFSTSRYSGEASSFNKYIKIASLLPDKTARDVAMRLRWLSKKEIGKRRKPDDLNASKKNKDKKDKSDSISTKAPSGHIRAGVTNYNTPPPSVDSEDAISNDAIGGTTGQLLEDNSRVILQIRNNLAAVKMACQSFNFSNSYLQLQENTDLFVRFRDNICAILNGMTNMPGIMSQMPHLPVKLNMELADKILPKPLPQGTPTSQP